jgi:hypothetical protein
MKKHRAKRQGLGLQIKSFKGKSGSTYIVFKSTKGSYHVFVETEAKAAARDCGIRSGNTRERWAALW